MTTRFVLVRHAACAQTDHSLLGRTFDAPLALVGHTQARSLALRLAMEKPAIVASSPRRRATQTAAAIAARTDCAVRIVDALDEIDFGDWDGASFAALARDSRWRDWNARRSVAATPAGETMDSARKRAADGLQALSREFAGATIFAVTHAEIIRAMLLHAHELPADDYWRIDIPPASMHMLLLRGSDFWTSNEESVAA